MFDPENPLHASWKAVTTATDEAWRQIQQALREVDRDSAEYQYLLDQMGALNKVRFVREPWADWLGVHELVHGGAYRIRSRNLTHGVWCEKREGFVGIREKFGDLFLFMEYHHDTGGSFGTVRPFEFIEMCPIEDLREYHSRCTEGRDVHFMEHDDGTGWQYHTDDNSRLPQRSRGEEETCKNYAYTNQPLFDWLTELQERVPWNPWSEDRTRPQAS